jgi:arylformamidase
LASTGDELAIVWRGMTAAQIAAQYNPQIAVADPARYGRENRAASEAARASLPGTLDVRYGPGPRQLLDVFPANGAGLRGSGLGPVLLFVHGGGWRTLDKSVYSFIAPPWSDAGAVTILPSYGLLPEVPLWRMVEEVREAIAWVRTNARSFGGDPERIVLAGMSAGAQLSGMALAHAPSAHVIRAAALASSVYDLEAHRWHGRHQDMALDDALVAKASPIRNPPLDKRLPISLSVGADETPEMLRQTRDYHAMLAARGHAVDLLIEPGRHHLNMGRAFAEPGSATFLALYRMLAETG